MQCVRWMCRVNRLTMKEYRITNNTLLERCGVQPMRAILTTRVVRWIGHVARMDNTRLPKQILFGKLVGLDQPMYLGGRKLRSWYLQCLGERGVGIEWFQLAQDRKRWRTVVSGEYEPPAGNPEAKVQPRKGRTKGGVIRATLKDRKRTVGTEMTVVCVICTKQCKGPKGLAQHMHRAHFPVRGFNAIRVSN